MAGCAAAAVFLCGRRSPPLLDGLFRLQPRCSSGRLRSLARSLPLHGVIRSRPRQGLAGNSICNGWLIAALLTPLCCASARTAPSSLACVFFSCFSCNFNFFLVTRFLFWPVCWSALSEGRTSQWEGNQSEQAQAQAQAQSSALTRSLERFPIVDTIIAKLLPVLEHTTKDFSPIHPHLTYAPPSSA